MSLPAVLLRISTGEILAHAPWPAIDGNGDPAPVPGLDPDLQWLLEYEQFPEPSPDTRYYTVQKTEEVTPDPHPTFAFANQYKITYTTPKRAVEEIEDHAYNAEQDALNNVFKPRDQIKLLALGIGVLFRSVDGLNLAPKETVIKNKCVSLALKVWNNDANVKAKIAAIAAGEEPDLDQGWEPGA